MGRNISSIVFLSPTQPTFLVPSGSTVCLDMDLTDITNGNLLIQVTYPKTATPTNCSINVTNGFGPQDASINPYIPIPAVLGAASGSTGSQLVHGTNVAAWSNTLTPVTMATIPTAQSGFQSAATFYNIASVSAGNISRWRELQITNLDPINTATIRVYLDSSV